MVRPVAFWLRLRQRTLVRAAWSAGANVLTSESSGPHPLTERLTSTRRFCLALASSLATMRRMIPVTAVCFGALSQVSCQLNMRMLGSTSRPPPNPQLSYSPETRWTRE